MNIGDTLKNLRKEQNLTQSQLAQELNIGQATIAGYENNSREPRIINLIAYANYFQCSVDFLIGREDDFGNILMPPQKQKFSSPTLSPSESKLLQIFSVLEPEHQLQILEYAQYFFTRNNILSKNKKRR